MTAILTGIFCVILAALLGVLWWLPSYVMTGTRQTLESAYAWQSKHYDMSFYERANKTDYTVAGEKGYQLHVQFVENPQPTTKYMILSHGYTDNRIGALKYARMYLEMGFHCVIYDLRGHGVNAPAFTTYGILEGADLKRLIEDTRSRYPQMTELGLHGESLGAATTITCLKYKPQVDFVVADCGFSDIENVLREQNRKAKAPSFVVDLADVGARMRYHYALKKMRPIDSLDENKVPILFLHGAADTFILPKNSEDMSKRTGGFCEYHTIPEADHAEDIFKNPGLYAEYVRGFLQKIGK